MSPIRCQRGFTLIEMVMVIVVLGIVAAMVAVFMRAPIDAYFDTARRAALTDVADTALRRMGRDIRKALPNSVRNPSPNCIEFLPTRTGARYRGEDISPGDGTALAFGVADTRFNMLGQNSTLPADQQIRANDIVVVYNLGIPGADAYAGDNSEAVSTVVDGAETVITLRNPKSFPLSSPGLRFHVIPGDETIVSYVCSGGRLYRQTGYGYATSCPAPVPGVTPVLAEGVQSCNFSYSGSDLQRNALVQLTLQLGYAAGESVSLYHAVHVDNTP
jgi:MSHA biogenesis protein MshO